MQVMYGSQNSYSVEGTTSTNTVALILNPDEAAMLETMLRERIELDDTPEDQVAFAEKIMEATFTIYNDYNDSTPTWGPSPHPIVSNKATP